MLSAIASILQMPPSRGLCELALVRFKFEDGYGFRVSESDGICASLNNRCYRFGSRRRGYWQVFLASSVALARCECCMNVVDCSCNEAARAISEVSRGRGKSG